LDGGARRGGGDGGGARGLRACGPPAPGRRPRHRPRRGRHAVRRPGHRCRDAVATLSAAPDSDVVVAVRIPTVGGPDAVLHAELASAAARTGRTTVACMDDLHGVTPDLTATDADGRTWTVPAYSTPEDGALALGH